VAGEGRQHHDRGHRQDGANGADSKEGRPPVTDARELEAGRHPDDRRHREGAHHDSHRAAATLGGHDVGDNRQRQRGSGTAEGAGEHARRKHAPESRGESASEGSDHETAQGDRQRLPPIESIEHQRAEHAAHGGCRRVAPSDDAEPGDRNAEPGREVRPERHHDHEVQYVDELDRRDDEQDAPFRRWCRHRLAARLRRQ
jgi:hypothetical protein